MKTEHLDFSVLFNFSFCTRNFVVNFGLLALYCSIFSLGFALPKHSYQNALINSGSGNDVFNDHFSERQIDQIVKRQSEEDGQVFEKRRWKAILQELAGGAKATYNTTAESFITPIRSHQETVGTVYVGQCKLPTKSGSFVLHSYRHVPSSELQATNPCAGPLEPVVLVAGDLSKFQGQNVPVRIHDQCLTSEVLGSQRCDCKEQLEKAKQYIQEHGGAIIYMQQEGRGIGLANKIAAYELQDQGFDTVDANRHLGFEDDHRSYECVPFILQDLGIQSIELMTNNPYKASSLGALKVPISGRIPMQVPANEFNEGYLRAKAERMSHELEVDGIVQNSGILP